MTARMAALKETVQGTSALPALDDTEWSHLANFIADHEADSVVLEVHSLVYGTVVLARELTCLFDASLWVNEVIVMAIGALLMAQYRWNPRGKVAVLEVYYWTEEKNPSRILERYFPEEEDLQRQTFWDGCQYLFCPICVNQTHWILLVVHLSRGYATLLDSFHGKWTDYANGGTLLATNLQLLFDTLFSYFPTRDWDSQVREDMSFPWQHDGSTCALYVMHAMETLACGGHEEEFDQPTWDDQRLFLRFHFASCILQDWMRHRPPVLPKKTKRKKDIFALLK